MAVPPKRAKGSYPHPCTPHFDVSLYRNPKHPGVQPITMPARSGPVPGYYRDPQGLPCLRWWDGVQWTAATAPLA